MIQVQVFTAEILKRFHVKVSEGYKLEMTLRLNYEPVEDIPFDLTPKEENFDGNYIQNC